MVGSQAGQPLHCRFVEGEPGDGSYSVSERELLQKRRVTGGTGSWVLKGGLVGRRA